MAAVHKLSTILASAEPGARAAITTAMHYVGSGIARGIWIHTIINASGFTGTPTHGGIAVSLFPATGPSQALTSRHSPQCVSLMPANGDAGQRFSRYFDCIVPKHFSLGVVNTTDNAVAGNALSVAIEYCMEA